MIYSANMLSMDFLKSIFKMFPVVRVVEVMPDPLADTCSNENTCCKIPVISNFS